MSLSPRAQTAALERPGQSITAGREELLRGRPVLLIDNEADAAGWLVVAAEFATQANVSFVVRHSSGFLRVAMSAARLDELNLPPMVGHTSDREGAVYSVAVDAVHNTTTGISAADRAMTVRTLVAPETTAADLNRPGHVLPVRTAPSGLLGRRGFAEGASDLCGIAGLAPAAMLAEVMNDDGSLARPEQLQTFAAAHGLAVVSLDAVLRYLHTRTNRMAPVHHVSLVVADAEMTAELYEKTLGWRRALDVVTGRDVAAAIGRILGFPGAPLEKVRLIMLQPPEASAGNVQLVEVMAPGPDAVGLPLGRFMVSHRSHDLDATWARLMSDGYEPICPPEEVVVGDWSTYCASVRHSDGVVLETVQYRP